MAPRRPLAPEDYIRNACDLHLQAAISEKSQVAVDRFLSKNSAPESSTGGGDNDGIARLFVWVPKKPQTATSTDNGGDEEWPEANASTDSFDGNNLGAIVFLNATASDGNITSIKSSAQIQVMTISPRVYEQVASSDDTNTNKDEVNEEKEESATQPQKSSNTFLSLQMYTRHCFVPAIRALEASSMDQSNNKNIQQNVSGDQTSEIDSSTDDEKTTHQRSEMFTGLEDKIRELDIAFGQSLRSSLGQIPHVILRAHPILAKTSSKISASGKMDLDELGLTAYVSDDAFLNEVQTGVSNWIQQIRRVTALPSTTPFPPGEGADLEEVAFWNQLDEALTHIHSELQKPEVQLTLSVLKAAHRFIATIALQNETNLDSAEKHTSDVVNYLKHYPAQSLAAARDFVRIGDALRSIFAHLPKVRASQFYHLDRNAKLLEASTLSLRNRMESILREKYKSNGIILSLSHEQYLKEVRNPTEKVFEQFDDEYMLFKDSFLELGRRGHRRISELSLTPAQILDNLVLAHFALRIRLNRIHDFRTSHEKLRQVVTEVLTGEDGVQDAVREVEEAPMHLFATVDLLDLGERGVGRFEAALEGYDRKIDAIEQRLAKLLRDKLTSAEDADEMFRVFARFHPLLSRARVQSAVKEYQIQLISTVTNAIQKLQSKFTHKYETSQSRSLATTRGIPPIAGKIMWAKQMERQVNFLMKKMADVLGEQWGQMLEGRGLRRAGDELIAKLDARAFFRAWVTDWENELSTKSNRLDSYPIRIERGDDSKYITVVNFDEKSEQLFREIRHLQWLGYEREIPRTLALLSEEALQRYPHAIVLKTALRSYNVFKKLLTPELELLVFPQIKAIRESISEAFSSSEITSASRRIRWSDAEMGEWVASLSELVSVFEERVEKLLRSCDRIDSALKDLKVVPYESKAMSEVIERVQKVVDELSLASFSSLNVWVVQLDKKMGDILAERLNEALIDWISTLNQVSEQFQEEKKEETEFKTINVTIPEINVEILLRNQEISASPSVPVVRSLFLNELHNYMGIVCQLSRPSSGRFEVFEQQSIKQSSFFVDETSFTHLVDFVKPETLSSAYECVESHLINLSEFVNQWLVYQSLWDTRLQDVTGAIGEDLDNWMVLLVEARDAREALDSSSTLAKFGPVTVRYDKVQSQVNLKYDAWQRDLQAGFANILGEGIYSSHEDLLRAKTDLEAVALEGATKDIVAGVTFIQEMKQKSHLWKEQVDKLCDCEKLLKRQRHTFKKDWLEASRAQGQFSNFEQILKKRSKTMEEQIPTLQQRVLAEDRLMNQRIAEIVTTWEDDKPLRGSLKPEDAIVSLSKFEVSMKLEKANFDSLSAAKDALALDASGENLVTGCLEELYDLKEVWTAMQVPYGNLDELKDILWSTCVTRKLRKSLDQVIDDLRSLPSRVRQYDVYTYFHDTVKKYISSHGILSDLKTDALKDRHWKVILKNLGINVPFSELTVGMLWEGGILARKKTIEETLTVAQGEMALEVFLQQVRDKWMKQELELVLYQNRVRLIRGWDNLFTALDDHTSGLVLMRSSPYCRAVREFQEEGKLWEERLTKLRGSFEAWIDVQRRWVYLEGIFFGSADIKAQLPAEWSRFKSVDGEFIALMRRMSQRPYAIEALNIENLQRTLDRLGNLMSVIQKALGEYLERQRSDFSRFYFLGDDDLLEIIGNSGEPGKVLSHLGKMFAGMVGASHNEEHKDDDSLLQFDGMLSKDGERVQLDEMINVKPKMAVKSWLKELEDGMQRTLAKLLQNAVTEDAFSDNIATNDESKEKFTEWAQKFPGQVMILATLINWSMSVDAALRKEGNCEESLTEVLNGVNGKLQVMAQAVLLDLPHESRKKFEQLITELVHQRDVTRSLIEDKVSNPTDFRWKYHLRFHFNPTAEKLTEKLCISLSNASFFYGFEYLGIGERLVQTPLTDRCYLTLTQALHFRMGGNPFGPAGTGKTESVKALGAQLGRFVVVMNCDETFDFGAMGRLFCGLCQVGAWGCFDEFNRLEERILSAVSQQILTIQRGLLDRQSNIELLGRSISLHDNVGIFVTMNPGYAGRSNLPDNLKTLFRSVAMVVPDRKLIAQVMLYSQGIVSAENLSGKIVTLFQNCESMLSKQSHYDFGLRALKTLLVSAGGLKRRALLEIDHVEGEALYDIEEKVLIQGACNNVVPKLVAEDLDIFSNRLESIFPGSEVAKMENEDLRKELVKICEKENLVDGKLWMQKVLQLKQVLDMRHGVMLVGPSGSGKSSALNVLMKGLEIINKKKSNVYIIDPKAMDKEGLYGVLDGTTMDWTDGVFTSLLRGILANQRGEADQQHWIIFDGDVDPEWAENLNSVLDDNKLLTLPSGERLNIPDNLRIILEVDSLAQATPATVSRCGMIWFSDDVISVEMCLVEFYTSLMKMDIIGNESDGDEVPSAQSSFLHEIKPFVISDDGPSLVADALEFALAKEHVMDPSRGRLLQSLRALVVKGIQLAIEYDENHPDYPMSEAHMSNFARRWLLYSIQWSFCGSASWDIRNELGELLLRASGESIPDGQFADYRVRVDDGELERWSESVPRMEIESHKVTATDVVITTTDTVRHSDVLGSWLSSRMPLILCGPPGSGKTMTLTSVLQSLQGIVLANLNFSSGTTPELLLKTFSQHCNYVRRGKNIVLEPMESLGAQSWLMIFCDEINLPENDDYGTQRVIMFMRQLIEQGGFWRHDNIWVTINRIQFVGACNPPSDAGRVEMSHRFMRHAPLLLVDFPAQDSLKQIYGTFNGGMMKLFPSLRADTEPLTEAMVELYTACKTKFTPEMQPHYFFSPRELSRWVRGIYEAIVDMDQGLSREELVRIWAHEALRLFCDRLVEESERKWTEEKIDEVARKYFSGIDHSSVLARPLFYSSWLSKETRRVDRDELKEFLSARLKVFYEEELDVPLVIFDEVLEHILRIDRVLRQPMGHCLLVGDSGAGKTVLSKFVSWMNGLNIFQIKAHSRYGIEEFNEDLRLVMRRVGIDGEKICFIFDEGNALGSGFLEAMNALLASGEVPGLFEGDDYTALMSACRDSAARDGVIVDSEEELWRRFTAIVQRNLHVVFTMNPSGGEWKNRSTTSPALFNRCVVDWFGTWSEKAMGEVGKEFTNTLDMGDAESVGGSWGIGDGEELMERVAEAFEGLPTNGLRQAVVAALVDFHRTTKEMADETAKSSISACRTYLSPRDYLALIHNFVTCLNSRRSATEEEQLHVNAGLAKLVQTQENVAELKAGLGIKGKELLEKEVLANNKLQQMVSDQNVAEKRKEEAEKMSVAVEKQQVQIDERKAEAQRDLDQAEPALIQAQQSVRGIKKRDLDEVRNLSRPPDKVRFTLEMLAIMLGEKKLEWADIRKMLSNSQFIPSIINFDVDKLTARQIKIVQEKYIDGKPDLNSETVMRSSKACGPLYVWAVSQIKYTTVYNRVQPLRDEVAQLEQEAQHAKDESARIEAEVKQLEESITQYKADYAILIRDVTSLKAEMETVSTKVGRAESLVKSLSRENERWSKSSEGFQDILRNLVGDALLMAGFLTYAGFFSFKARLALSQRWRKSLDVLGIEYREGLGMVESLSTASQRLQWETMGLQDDSLSTENGVILNQCVRFPLVIDPSGQAIDFLMNKYKDQKIQCTSFLDKAFMKTLAGAVRFGTTLLIENVETIDPVLNPILNKEIQKTGGRSLVRIGTEDVDYSPKFQVILSTKDPAAQLTPDLCSRVTLVNFTVTPASLQSQARSLILTAEKPEVEEKRISLIKLQGEQNVKMRELEDQMLSTISAVEGSILDDDRVVAGMEVLMKEGAHVVEQIASSSEIMAEVHQTISKFEGLSDLCRKLFVLLGQMRSIFFLYEFSAKAFMQILTSVLTDTERISTEDDNQRMERLSKNLFSEAVARVGRGLLANDKMVFAILLARILKEDVTESIQDGALEDITQAIEDVFGSSFEWSGRGLSSLKTITVNEVDCSVPLMLCSAPGHDVSGRVEAMSRAEKKELAAVAMGSEEGFTIAEQYLTSASKRGTWVMLKNCHLCTDWLREILVKKLQSLGASSHPNFRLFITTEINQKLPTSLLRLSDIIVAEAPTGVKATISRFFSSISPDRFGSTLRNRLYLVLAWLHAVIQERLRYVPIGWTEKYEFTEADATHALDAIDALVEDATGGKQHVAPEKLPWDALRSTLSKSIFGGRIANDSDQMILDKLVNSIIVPECFDVDFRLADVDGAPCLPEGSSEKECLDWIDSLPFTTPPSWIGLDSDAESERAKMIARSVYGKVMKMEVIE